MQRWMVVVAFLFVTGCRGTSGGGSGSDAGSGESGGAGGEGGRGDGTQADGGGAGTSTSASGAGGTSSAAGMSTSSSTCSLPTTIDLSFRDTEVAWNDAGMYSGAYTCGHLYIYEEVPGGYAIIAQAYGDVAEFHAYAPPQTPEEDGSYSYFGIVEGGVTVPASSLDPGYAFLEGRYRWLLEFDCDPFADEPVGEKKLGAPGWPWDDNGCGEGTGSVVPYCGFVDVGCSGLTGFIGPIDVDLE